jgi:hypothetical protein
MVAITPGLFESTNLPPELAARNSRVVGAVSLVGPLGLDALSANLVRGAHRRWPRSSAVRNRPKTNP